MSFPASANEEACGRSFESHPLRTSFTVASCCRHSSLGYWFLTPPDMSSIFKARAAAGKVSVRNRERVCGEYPSSQSLHAKTPNGTGNVLSHGFHPFRTRNGEENMGLFVEKLLRISRQQQHSSKPGPAPPMLLHKLQGRSHTPEARADLMFLPLVNPKTSTDKFFTGITVTCQILN